LTEGGDRVSSTYAIEIGGPVPALLHGRSGRGRAFPELHLRGRMGYQRYRFFDKTRTLLGTLAQIDAWAEDPGVGGVVLDLSGMRIAPEMLWELHTQLAGLRARGKRVVVYADELNMYSYMLACVADEIWMDPQGGLDLIGLTLGRTYMRHALDKLGVGVDEWRFFTYKSAFEGYARDSMSEPDREQRQALVDDAYEHIARTATAARGLTRARWDALVDSVAAFRPQAAQAAGLIDSIGGFAKARDAARRAAPRAGADVEAQAQALGGIHGDPVWGPEEWSEPPRIAVLYAIGPCAMEEGIRGRILSGAIEKAREDRNVKAVVLRADSPGGDPLPADLVARELRATAKRKPVIVSQGQLAASGGYWISMDADTIVASPLTITGSIGVIAGFLWNKELGDKLGLDYDHVQRGAHADLGQGFTIPFLNVRVPARPVTTEERAHAEKLIRDLYGEFVDAVAAGRGMTPASVDAIGQGRVWSGTRGREIGLVDELGGLWRGIEIAKQAAGIPPARAITITEGPDRGAFDASRLRPRLLGVDAGSVFSESPVASPFTAAETDYLRALAQSRGKPLLWLDPLEILDGGPLP
jgi:protease-4